MFIDSLFSNGSIRHNNFVFDLVGDTIRWLVVLSCIANSRYLSMTNEQTEDLMCVMVICREKISETINVTSSYGLESFSKPFHQSKPHV
jgi:hypothetical protein